MAAVTTAVLALTTGLGMQGVLTGGWLLLLFMVCRGLGFGSALAGTTLYGWRPELPATIGALLTAVVIVSAWVHPRFRRVDSTPAVAAPAPDGVARTE